ncbi:MAG: hypothetical protein ABI655_14420 [Phenylobacterium sp.]
MGLSILIAAALAAATPGSLAENPPTRTIVCLDVGGASLPAVCRVPASRLDQREDICLCPRGMQVTAPICPPGVRPPAESGAFERARRLASRDGSLVGDLYAGKPMCVAARNSR